MLNHVVVCYRPHTFSPRPAAAALAALRCSDGLRSNTLLIVWALANVARPDMQAYPSLRPLARCLFILVVMSMAHRLTCKKLRVLSRLRRSQPAPNIRNPAPLRTHWCPCVASSSCLALGKCQKMLERARHFLPLSSLLLTYSIGVNRIPLTVFSSSVAAKPIAL